MEAKAGAEGQPCGLQTTEPKQNSQVRLKGFPRAPGALGEGVRVKEAAGLPVETLQPLPFFHTAVLMGARACPWSSGGFCLSPSTGHMLILALLHWAGDHLPPGR